MFVVSWKTFALFHILRNDSRISDVIWTDSFAFLNIFFPFRPKCSSFRKKIKKNKRVPQATPRKISLSALKENYPSFYIFPFFSWKNSA